MKKVLISRVINNNVLLVEENDQDYILVGKGIGFGRKKGQYFENIDNIEEKYISLKGLKENEYEEFLTKVELDAFEIVQNIVRDAEKELGYQLNPKKHVGLIDHINFAIQRLKNGMEVTNPFLYETKFLYPKEYEFAKKTILGIKERLGIDIPEDEAGFIALHLYGGKKNNSKDEALNTSRLINAILRYVERKLQIYIDRESFECARFMMHIRSFISRVKKGKFISEVVIPDLEEKMPLEYKVAYDIGKIVGRVFKVKVPEGELGYIALHLHKLNSNIK